MIYTLTLNPSLDYIVEVEHFETGKTNRSKSEVIRAGGKGINVSLMLNELGVENIALGIACGFTGKEILRQIEQQGLHHQFVYQQEGDSRINIKFAHDETTEINANGPELLPESVELLLKRIGEMCENDLLIISGSAPKSFDEKSIQQLANKIRICHVSLILDCTGLLFKTLLKCHPLMVKPNKAELENFFHNHLDSLAEIENAGLRLKELGAQNILISLGGDGAVLIDKNKIIYQCPAPEGQVISPLGSGDCMVAGVVYGLINKYEPLVLLQMAVACGSASAYCEHFATKTLVLEYKEKLINQYRQSNEPMI